MHSRRTRTRASTAQTAINTKTSAQLTNGTANPGFVSLTDPSRGRADPTYDYCETQCWYDNYVVSPVGHPDIVYVGGSFDYNLFGNNVNNGRAVLLSRDAGDTWNDQQRDNASPTTGIHPDQHALVVDPANPLLFFEGSDGGVVRSSGQLTDASANCDNPDLGPMTRRRARSCCPQFRPRSRRSTTACRRSSTRACP